jgi:hypothetical protein
MTGRERTRLQKAQANGYLDARCKDNQALVHAYGLWCWRLKIAMVWLERRSRYSRYARVHLEMFTSANRLTPGGQAGMKDICAPGNVAARTRVSAHDACWDHVALANAAELARAVFRAAVRPDNCERNQIGKNSLQERKTGRILQMVSA